LKRALQKWIDDYITEFIIESSPKQGSTLNIDYDKEGDKSVVSIDTPIETKSTKRKKKE
jgi:ATP-dependent Clp protease ATP-binding subunit ClpC